MELSPTILKFDSEFWRNKLRELGYSIRPMELDVTTLKGQKALSSDLDATRVLRLYFDDYVEVALIEFDACMHKRE